MEEQKNNSNPTSTTLADELRGLKESMTSRRVAFRNGVISGLGSLCGFMVGVIVIGWMLNVLGYFSAFHNTLDQLQSALNRAQSVQVQKIK